MIQVRPSQNTALKRRPFVDGPPCSLLAHFIPYDVLRDNRGDDCSPGILEEFHGKLGQVPATGEAVPISSCNKVF